MVNNNYKISIFSIHNSIRNSETITIDDYDELIEYLEDNGIVKVSLKYHTILDDTANWLENGSNLKIEELTYSHFQWLITDNKNQSRYLEVEYKLKKPYVMECHMMHKKLIPYKEKTVKRYFNPISQEEHLNYFRKSIDRYKEYETNQAKFSHKKYKIYRQAEKDERFYTTRTFINLFERTDKKAILKKILVNAFGEIPPIKSSKKYPQSWDNLVTDDMTLCFEKDLPAPKEYKEFLSNNLNKRHFVEYIIDSGTDKDGHYRKNLEGPSQIDAFIECKSSRLKIIIEAKYLSDISCDVTYDVTRNQIARNIDVMLEQSTDMSLFLLITPQYFKERPNTKLYGYKMNDYMNNYLTLMADLSHRSNIEPSEWQHITKRIAWITWEELKKLGL